MANRRRKGSAIAKPFNFGEVKLTAGDESRPPIPDPEVSFCIALLGDFSGRANHHICEPASIARRRALVVDRDNFDEMVAKIAPEIQLPIESDGAPLRQRFSELDDFHPDRIFEKSPMFKRLREVRLRLSDPGTFSSAAGEMGIRDSERTVVEKPAPERAAATATASRLASGSLLDEMIEQTEARAPQMRSQRTDELQDFVRRVTEPHTVAAADPRQAEVVAVIDRAIGSQMRALLHMPDFQAMEAAWRALLLLVRRVETNTQLKLYLIDISKEELAADLTASSDLTNTGLYELLVEKSVGTAGAEPWAVIAGNYTFGPTIEDAELLGRMAKIASVAGAPFIAGASPRLVGCASFESTPEPRTWKALPVEAAQAWDALRALPEASSIGLVLPRFLLRLPYGKKTDPIEAFDFEEMPDAPKHEDYLWGNSAFACALLLAQSFGEDGWEMRPGEISEIDRLPLHVYERDNDSELKPCAECLMTEAAAGRIMEDGIMVLASLKGRDAVRLVRFQSIASPLRGLAGRWL